MSSENETKKPPEELGINSSENMTDEENRAFNRSITERMMSYLENKYDEEFELKGRVSTSSRYGRTYKVYAPETDYTFEPAIHGDKDTPIEEWNIHELYFQKHLNKSIDMLMDSELEQIFGEMIFSESRMFFVQEFEDEFLKNEVIEEKYIDSIYIVEQRITTNTNDKLKYGSNSLEQQIIT